MKQIFPVWKNALNSLLMRPPVPVATAYIGALFFCFFTSRRMSTIVAYTVLALILLPVLLMLFKKLSPRSGIILILCLSSVFGARAAMNASFFDDMEKIETISTADITGTVTAVTFSESYMTYFDVKTDSCNGDDTSYTVSVEANFNAEVKPFDRVCLSGALTPIANTGVDGYYYSDIADRCLGTLIVTGTENLEITGRETRSVFSVCSALRDRCTAVLQKQLPPEDAAIATALLLGDRAELAPELKRDFRRLGLSHVLAVSGMHLSIIIAGLGSLLLFLRVPQKARVVLQMLATVLFMGVVGFSSSVVRAGIMLLIYHFGFLINGQSDGVNSLFTAVLVICVISPLSIFDVGLQLSFLASLGIILMSRNITIPGKKIISRHPLLGGLCRTVVSMVGATIAAVVFTLPVIYLNYRELSILSPLTNLFMIIPVTVILYASSVLLITYGVGWIARPVSGIISLSCDVVRLICKWFSGFGKCLISLRYPFVLPLFLIALTLTLVTVILFRRRFIPYVGVLCACLAFFVCLTVWNEQHENKPEIRYFQDGSVNDAIFIGENGRMCLIDNSTGTYRRLQMAADMACESVYPDIDVLMLTHLRSIQESSLVRLCRCEYVRSVWLPEPTTEEETVTASRINASLEGYVNEIRTYPYTEDNASCQFETVSISIVKETMLKRSVQKRIAVFLETEGQGTLLLPPAFSENGENDLSLLAPFIVRADTLLFSAHGPKYKTPFSLSEAWIGNTKTMIFANETVASFADETMNGTVIRGPSTILLSP